MKPALIITIVVVLSIFIVGIILRKRVNKELNDSLKNSDYDKYRKIIFSPFTPLFIDGNNINLLKSADLVSNGDFDKATKLMPVIIYQRLNYDQKVMYFQLCNLVAINNKDQKLFEKVHEELEKLEDKDGLVKAMIEENEINQKLYCNYDKEVITLLKKLVDKNNGVNKGKLMMSLAKAYYLNKQESEAVETLKKAKKYLKNQPQERIVEMTLNNIDVLAG